MGHPSAWVKVWIYLRRRLSLSCWNICEITFAQISGQNQTSISSNTWVDVHVRHHISQALFVCWKSQWYLGNSWADFRCACSVFVLQSLATSFGMVINSLGLHLICDLLQDIFEKLDCEGAVASIFIKRHSKLKGTQIRNGGPRIGWTAPPGFPAS